MSEVENSSGTKKRSRENEAEGLEGPIPPKRAKLSEDTADTTPDTYGPILVTTEPKEQLTGEDGWTKVRNEATEDMPSITSSSMTSDRAEWMTLLPDEKISPSFDFNYDKLQTNVTQFSKRGRVSRGDTSGWTDTPQDAQARASGSAKMSSLDDARKLAAERFKREEAQEYNSMIDEWNSKHRSTSLYEQVKQGIIAPGRTKNSGSSSSESDSSSIDSSSEDERHKSRSKKHRSSEKRKSKDKRRDKDRDRRDKDRDRRDKDRDRRDKHKEKDKHKDKHRHKSKSSRDPQISPVLSTASRLTATDSYWDRERDLVRFGSQASEAKRSQVFRDASMLNTRFYSGGTSTGPSNLK